LKKFFGTSNLTAYDSTGHQILGPVVANLGSKIPAVLTGATGHHVDGLLGDSALPGAKGAAQVTAFARLKNPDWTLAVQEPAAQLYGPVDRQYNRSLALLLGLSVASFLAAAFAASKLDAWHRRVADERARLAAVIDRLPAGVAVVGPDARIVMANSSALDALGALGGTAAATSLGAEVPPTVLARIGASGETGEDDISVVLDGVERFFAVRSTPVGRRRGGVGAVTLVEETTARQAEERRRMAVADLLTAISVSDTSASIAEVVVGRSHDAIGCDWCALVVVGANDSRLVTLASDQDRSWLDIVEGGDDRTSVTARAVADQRIVDVGAQDGDGPDDTPVRTIVLPLQSAGRAVGAVALGYRRGDTRVDIGELSGFAAQVALALDRARRREIEHDVSLTLQRTLLASAPVHEVDLSVALRYQPAADQMLVGGDFYDVIPLDDVSHLLLIGDVVGHGLEAATTMGQLKIAIRAFAQEDRSPARILSKLDAFVSDQLESARYSTAAMVVVDRTDGVLRAAVAGHPPPLLRQGDGTVSALPVVQQPLLGLPPAGGRTDRETPLTPGATGLCLYTDGLIERPDLLLDAGIARLSDALSHADGWDVERTAEQLMALVGAGPHRDDVALLYALIHA
jgi:PAS domain-containing protein